MDISKGNNAQYAATRSEKPSRREPMKLYDPSKSRGSYDARVKNRRESKLSMEENISTEPVIPSGFHNSAKIRKGVSTFVSQPKTDTDVNWGLNGSCYQSSTTQHLNQNTPVEYSDSPDEGWDLLDCASGNSNLLGSDQSQYQKSQSSNNSICDGWYSHRNHDECEQGIHFDEPKPNGLYDSDEDWDAEDGCTNGDASCTQIGRPIQVYAQVPTYTFEPLVDFDQEQLVYIDVETTGLNVERDHILQIAAQNGMKKFNKYIYTRRPIHPQAAKVHSIHIKGDAMFYKGYQVDHTTLYDAIRSFIQFLRRIDNPVIVAHNGLHFDMCMIYISAAKVSCAEMLKSCVFGFVDSLDLCRNLYGYGGNKLGALYERFTGETFNAHEATSDVIALKTVLEHIVEENGFSVVQRRYYDWQQQLDYIFRKKAFRVQMA